MGFSQMFGRDDARGERANQIDDFGMTGDDVPNGPV